MSRSRIPEDASFGRMLAIGLAVSAVVGLDARPAAAAPPLPTVAPSAVGLSAERLSLLDSAMNEAIARRELPGAVLLVGRHGKVAFRKAYGFRALEPDREPMTVDTVFDLASLTKPIATAPSVLALVEDGKVRLSDPVVKHIPGFGAGGGAREKVTIEQLLTHRSGLPPDDPMELYTETPEMIFPRSYAQPLPGAPGEKFVYSDVGYEVLAEVVRAVSGLPLDRFAQARVFGPLGMEATEFRPGGKGRLPLLRIAPTEKRDGRFLRGEVHDPHAFALGGVAGHAGLFSTADDLARFCAALLADLTEASRGSRAAPDFGNMFSGGGEEPLDTRRGFVLSPAGVAALTRPRFAGDADVRALGWDVATAYASTRGDLFPLGSFGHTGWTGTSVWLDPTTDTFVILLSNRNHPDGRGNVVPLRAKVASIVASAITDVSAGALAAASREVELLLALGRTGAARDGAAHGAVGGTGQAPVPRNAAGEVLAGIDVLEKDGFAAIANKRIALLTNQTGVTKDGRATIDVLRSHAAVAVGVRLARLFSPEHGIRGAVDERVPDTRDEKSGLPIRSLYGAHERPAPEDLAGIDALVIDLQDAGCRFYSYIATMLFALEEAAKAKVAVVVLDRPDPIRADVIEGPVSDTTRVPIVSPHAIPLRTGMTLGELARMFDAEKRLGASLTVVKMTGYRRDLWYDETGLPWIDPSPNLRSPTAAALYPGVALLEKTNVSVGRGTTSPFELVGAPFVDGGRLAATLNLRAIPGVRFTPVRFTPDTSTFKGEACGGVRISLVDRDALRAVTLGLELAAALRDVYAKEWDRREFGLLLANGAALGRFERGDSAAQIVSAWAADVMDFERRRAPFLLYR